MPLSNKMGRDLAPAPNWRLEAAIAGTLGSVPLHRGGRLLPGSAGVPPARRVTDDDSTRRRDADAPRAGNPVQFRRTKLVMVAKRTWGNDFTANSGRATGLKSACGMENRYSGERLFVYFRQLAFLVAGQKFL